MLGAIGMPELLVLITVIVAAFGLIKLFRK
jgi:hypothetical protein